MTTLSFATKWRMLEVLPFGEDAGLLAIMRSHNFCHPITRWVRWAFMVLTMIVPGLLNHIPVPQLDGHSPILISILKRKNTGDEDHCHNKAWKMRKPGKLFGEQIWTQLTRSQPKVKWPGSGLVKDRIWVLRKGARDNTSLSIPEQFCAIVFTFAC